MNANHLSDEQLIDHLYGVGRNELHLPGCAECQARMDDMQTSRTQIEAQYRVADTLNHEVLAAQRRAIYGRMDGLRARPWAGTTGRVWASAALGIALFGGGLLIHEEPQLVHSSTPSQPKISDAELVDQVSQIADSSEPAPTAPLEALFED